MESKGGELEALEAPEAPEALEVPNLSSRNVEGVGDVLRRSF